MSETVKKKMGRPVHELDEEQLRALLRLKPTLEDVAAFFRCSTSKIEKYIRETWNVTFSEFRSQNMVTTRFNLVRTAVSKAESGDNCMLIFCLKNLCGWKDRYEQLDDDQPAVKADASNVSKLYEIAGAVNKSA